MRLDRSFRRTLLLASVLASGLVPLALAQTRPGTPNPNFTGNGTGGTPGSDATATLGQAPGGAIEQIRVRAQRRLVREKNSPSAVTELGTKQIAQVGAQGSIATLLRQAPSVNVYQQGIGNNEPVLSIRGVRGLEVAQTLDGVPMQDLLNGGTGGFLQNILGGRFNLDQISNVSIYPGVAYPNENTFGTIGGTVAYSSLRPSVDPSVEVLGSVGSFGTFQEGVTLNTGQVDGLLGRGDNAPDFMFKYSNEQTKGYIDNTPARFNNFEFATDKPYDDGLSKFQGTILYNTASGLYTPEPIPLPYLQQNGMFSNYPNNIESARQTNQYLSIILKDDTYINDIVSAGLSVFYLHSDNFNEDYGSPELFSPPGVANQYAPQGAAPFIQVPAGFGTQGLFGPGGLWYNPIAYSYNGTALFPPGSTNCPTNIANQWKAYGQTSPCGYNATLNTFSNDSYGIQPRVTITPPAWHGIVNTIQAGALIAKETQPNSPFYVYGSLPVPQTPGNLIPNNVPPGYSNFDGGAQRTIYQGYVQDKIDFLHNTLHITPGATLEGTNSSETGSNIYLGNPPAAGTSISPALLANPYCQAGNFCNYGNYSSTKWDREFLPFLNVTYDLDRILPAARGVSLYGSTGTSALFAPVTDFGPNTTGSPPYASIVHLYEGGVQYDTSKLALRVDYFYQKVDRDFGYFQYQSGPLAGVSSYTNSGQREFKGVEGSAIWQLSHDWQLFGNFSHTLAKYLKTELGFATVQEDQYGIVQRGTPVSGVPDWLSTFGVDYDHRNVIKAGDEFHARFEGQYTGHQPTTYDVNGFFNFGPLSNIPGSLAGSYQYYNTTAGSTTYDPNGGLSPFVIFNLDMNYSLPIKPNGFLKKVDFDLNFLNLFDNKYFAYFYKQISPSSCGTFTSGPFKGQSVSNYGCTPSFADGLPGEPFAVTFTTTVKF